jgi:hypothetical protein
LVLGVRSACADLRVWRGRRRALGWMPAGWAWLSLDLPGPSWLAGRRLRIPSHEKVARAIGLPGAGARVNRAYAG